MKYLTFIFLMLFSAQISFANPVIDRGIFLGSAVVAILSSVGLFAYDTCNIPKCNKHEEMHCCHLNNITLACEPKAEQVQSCSHIPTCAKGSWFCSQFDEELDRMVHRSANEKLHCDIHGGCDAYSVSAGSFMISCTLGSYVLLKFLFRTFQNNVCHRTAE